MVAVLSRSRGCRPWAEDRARGAIDDPAFRPNSLIFSEFGRKAIIGRDVVRVALLPRGCRPWLLTVAPPGLLG